MSYYMFQKKKEGKRYWYLGRSERTKIGVRRTWQQYLGTATAIKDKISPLSNAQITSRPFGSIAAMLSIAEELDLKKIISKVVPDNNYKLSIFEHVIMQSICRFNKPLSRKSSIRWFKSSILPLLWKKDFKSPQTIFNQFDKIVNLVNNKIPKIEEELLKVLLEKGIKPSTLIWDPTNFFTYIEKSKSLARKGASKEKRFDKNLINLGLVVSEDNIPLMHKVYAGNERESSIITDITNTISERLKKFGFGTENIVFVFDKGNNSKENIPPINKKFHIIGSLRKNQLSHLFDLPFDKFKYLYTTKKKNEINGFRAKETIYGKEYTLVVTHNEKTAKKQKEKIETAIKKISEKFKEIENGLQKSKKKTTIKGISKRINDFLHKQYRVLFDWEFVEKEQKLSWKINEENLKFKEKTYGKSILFTDLHNWETKNIAKTYNSKTIVESDFKALKDKLLIPVKPFHIRKDEHIRVHVFICVLSMLLYRYMQWRLKEMNLSENNLSEELKNMRLAFIKQEGSNSIRKVLENMTPEQIDIYSKLNLREYLPD